MSDILLNALIGGLIVVLMTGPLGCFVVWRRMAYFGDALSHAGLLGLAIAVMLALPPFFGFAISSLLVAGLLLAARGESRLGTDSILGLIAYGALAIGVIAFSFGSTYSFSLESVLFGDLLAIGPMQLLWLYGLLLVVLFILLRYWRPMVLMTFHSDLAQLRGLPVRRLTVLLVLALALAVAGAIPLVGALMVTALLIAPAATARLVTQTPGRMMGVSILAGMVSVVAGLGLSYLADWPTGPTIVLASVTLFLVTRSAVTIRSR